MLRRQLHEHVLIFLSMQCRYASNFQQKRDDLSPGLPAAAVPLLPGPPSHTYSTCMPGIPWDHLMETPSRWARNFLSEFENNMVRVGPDSESAGMQISPRSAQLGKQEARKAAPLCPGEGDILHCWHACLKELMQLHRWVTQVASLPPSSFHCLWPSVTAKLRCSL